jgi:hypothetical protein
MFSFIAGLVFLTLGNLDKTPFSHVPEDPDEARRRLRAEHIAAIMKAAQESEKNPNKRKRTNLAQNAKLYDQIHGENEQLVAEFNAEAEIKNAQDPNFEIPNRREFWKLLGAFTATVDGEVELFVFGLGPNSHLGQVHELESKSVKKIFWPAVASVKSLTMYTQRTTTSTLPHKKSKHTKHFSPQSLDLFQNISSSSLSAKNWTLCVSALLKISSRSNAFWMARSDARSTRISLRSSSTRSRSVNAKEALKPKSLRTVRPSHHLRAKTVETKTKRTWTK